MNDNSPDLDLALSVAGFFRIKPANAEKIISEVKQSLSQWRRIALEYQILKGEIEMMAEIFEPS